jgi:hypothetical protein
VTFVIAFGQRAGPSCCRNWTATVSAGETSGVIGWRLLILICLGCATWVRAASAQQLNADQLNLIKQTVADIATQSRRHGVRRASPKYKETFRPG